MKRPTNSDLEKMEGEIVEISSELQGVGEALKAMSTTSYELKPECLFGIGILIVRISGELSALKETYIDPGSA